MHACEPASAQNFFRLRVVHKPADANAFQIGKTRIGVPDTFRHFLPNLALAATEVESGDIGELV
jgi:hypothetical protein